MNYIDLENSFSFFGVNKLSLNIWRGSILAVVFDHDDNKYYYLTKECISEHIQNDHIDKNPFYNLWGYACTNVSTSDNAITTFRIASINPRDSKFNFKSKLFSTFTAPEENAVSNKIKYVKYEEKSVKILNEELKKFDDKNIYCLINFEIDKKKFNVFFRCEYLNFGHSKSYLQPIQGHIPFLYKEKLYLAYFVKYIGEDMEGDLEIMYGDYTTFFNSFKKKSLNPIKLLLKKIVNFIFPYTYDCDNYVNIKKSTIKFYKKI